MGTTIEKVWEILDWRSVGFTFSLLEITGRPMPGPVDSRFLGLNDQGSANANIFARLCKISPLGDTYKRTVIRCFDNKWALGLNSYRE